MLPNEISEEWKVIADAVPGLLAYFDADRRLLLANRRCREWLGGGEDLRGRSMEEVLGQPGYSRFAPHLERAASGHESVFETEMSTPAGPRSARVTLYPHLDPPRRPKGYAAIMLDLLGRHDAGERDAAKVMHEFNNLLTTIGGNAEICLSLVDPRHPMLQSLVEIKRAAERAAALTWRMPCGSTEIAHGLSAPAPTQADAGPEIILLVEDEDLVRKLAARILQSAGYAVLEAASGLEALDAVRAHRGRIPLLLTDVMMPGMGGRELVQRLKPLRPGMSVLYMSGYIDDAILRYALQESGAAFLPKPFAPAALLQKVRELLAPVGAPG